MAGQQGGSRRGRGEEQERGQGARTGQGREQQETRGGGPAAGGTEREREVPMTRDRGGDMGERGEVATTGGRGREGIMGRGGQPAFLPAFMANPGLMASAFLRDPLAFAQVMSDEMDRLVSTVGYDDMSLGERGGAGGRVMARGAQGRGLARGQWNPTLEVFQRGDELVVRADLPGVKVDDVSLDVEDGLLVISGERRDEHEDRREGFYRSERRYGSFTRTVALPEGVDEDRIDASFRDGVLEVTVPLPRQQEQSRGRRIQVRGGEATREVGRGGGAKGGEGRPSPADAGVGKVGA
jgi:HSP20 family protein